MSASRPNAPQDPYPLSPHQAAVVNGARVTLVWEPVADAATYAVEVAEDPEFRHVVFAREIPAGVSEFALDGQLPDDGRTFFWRISAANAQGWSEGERIESFISGTEAQAGHFPVPDEREPFGPLGGLLRATTLQAGAEVTPGRQAVAERVLGEKPEGVEAAELVTVGLGLIMAAAVVLAVVFFLLIATIS